MTRSAAQKTVRVGRQKRPSTLGPVLDGAYLKQNDCYRGQLLSFCLLLTCLSEQTT